MRINANSNLTLEDVQQAINLARTPERQSQDIYLEEGWTGPRGQVQFWCNSAYGKYATGRNHNRGRAASWTAWGWVIAELFTRDPDAHIGIYRGRDHFIRHIYGEQRRYIIRQSLGNSRAYGPGCDCGFLSLFDSEILDARYSEMVTGTNQPTERNTQANRELSGYQRHAWE